MWKFWAVLIVLMLGAGGYALMAGRSKKAEEPLARAPAASEPIVASPAEPVPAPSSIPPAATPRPEPVVVEPAPEAPAVVAPPAPAPLPESPAEPAGGAASPEEPFEELIPGENEVTPPAPVTPPEAPGAAPLPKFGDFEVLPAKVEKREDGSLLLDGKYVVKGAGTAENPYVVPWDLLVSVEEAFDPQNGRRRLPERITMIDGRHVRISGYVAFPMTDKEPRELLSMLNQWDGCCIGTPPTPYDAIEVALREPVVGDDRFATTGRVAGVFHVKPYLQGDWLIGLYVMDDATLTPRDFGGAGAN